MTAIHRIKRGYWLSRSWFAQRRQFLLNSLILAPVILVILSILSLGLLVSGPKDSSSAWYSQAASRAMSTNDYAAARLCYASLLQKQPNNPAYKYGLAITLSKLGEETASTTLMRQLAPEDGPGYAPAQLDIARELINAPSPKPESLRAAEARLNLVLKMQPKNADAHTMLAVIYSKSERWELANEHMVRGGEAFNEQALTAALAFAKRGDPLKTGIWARRATAYYAPRVKAEPKNDDLRLRYAQSYLLLHDFPKALEILDAGWRQDSKPLFRKAVAQVSAMWLKESPTMAIPRRLALLENALTWDPQNATLLAIVLDPETASAASQVNPTTALVGGASIRALVQAIANCRNNQPDKAKSELKLAMNLGGQPMASLTAYVCGVWAESKTPDAAWALTLSTILLEIQPKEPVAQWALGKVLAQQEKWAQSIPYLEAALAALPNDPSIHASLAAAYENIGQTALAAQHHRLAQSTTAPTTAPSTAPTNAISSRRIS